MGSARDSAWIRFLNDRIDLRRLARIDTLKTLFVVLFVEHEADAWHSRGSLSRVVDGCHRGCWLSRLPTTCFPLTSVELDLRTSYTFAISDSHKDAIKDPVPDCTVSRDQIKSTID